VLLALGVVRQLQDTSGVITSVALDFCDLIHPRTGVSKLRHAAKSGPQRHLSI